MFLIESAGCLMRERHMSQTGTSNRETTMMMMMIIIIIISNKSQVKACKIYSFITFQVDFQSNPNLFIYKQKQQLTKVLYNQIHQKSHKPHNNTHNTIKHKTHKSKIQKQSNKNSENMTP